LPATAGKLAFFRPEAPAKVFNRALTFEERVSYQRTIEEVYWRHRIWPKERPDPKPALDAVMSQAQLEKKVTDYLRNSQALEDYWQRPITAEQLQAEMDRMAKHTKQPEVLRELFEALGNDSFVIAECLARPTLVESVLQSVEGSQDANGKAKRPTDSQYMDPRLSTSYSLPPIGATSHPEGVCIDDTWTATSLASAPSQRYFHTAVWTGNEMIVWGGYPNLSTGGRYNPSADSWTATSTTNSPSGRYRHTAVWTGSEMIVWGGIGVFGDLRSGGRYNPSSDNWTDTSTTNSPSGREFHTAVWTGSEMIVWGGHDGFDYFNDGGRYNPGTDSWTATTSTNAPDRRYSHTAVWAGSEMIVWGGADNTSNFNSGGRYCAQSGPTPTPTPTPRVTPRPRPTPHVRPSPPG
jgi:hypothetical protein